MLLPKPIVLMDMVELARRCRGFATRFPFGVVMVVGVACDAALLDGQVESIGMHKRNIFLVHSKGQTHSLGSCSVLLASDSCRHPKGVGSCSAVDQVSGLLQANGPCAYISRSDGRECMAD
jgi:hypothetical protein